MRKRWKKKKKRDLSFAGLGEGFLAHPGRERASGRAYGPAAAHERRGRRRGCARATASLRVHSSVRAEGGGNGVGEPAERGRRAGRRRCAAGGPVLGPREGGLARAEAGDSKGRLNSARGGWEVAEFRGGDRRRWALGEGLGLGSGASGSWPREGAARLT
jgi:hypothetical protein